MRTPAEARSTGTGGRSLRTDTVTDATGTVAAAIASSAIRWASRSSRTWCSPVTTRPTATATAP